VHVPTQRKHCFGRVPSVTGREDAALLKPHLETSAFALAEKALSGGADSVGRTNYREVILHCYSSSERETLGSGSIERLHEIGEGFGRQAVTLPHAAPGLEHCDQLSPPAVHRQARRLPVHEVKQAPGWSHALVGIEGGGNGSTARTVEGVPDVEEHCDIIRSLVQRILYRQSRRLHPTWDAHAQLDLSIGQRTQDEDAFGSDAEQRFSDRNGPDTRSVTRAAFCLRRRKEAGQVKHFRSCLAHLSVDDVMNDLR